MTLPKSVLEGKYEVVRPLNEGGMGKVYLVRHLHLDELRVIKVIRRKYAGEKELQQRFLREARIAIRLRHPKIAQIFDFSIAEDGTANIIMEYIEGKTLQALLRQGGPPELELTLDIAIQALEALGYLHRKGYLHRDISPDNLMLTRDFEGDPLVKLIDLGIAKRIEQDPGMNLTATGMFVGKALYSSPEQFGKRKMDPRSDLYSFGILLYELLTEHRPVEGQTLSELISAHLFHPPLSFDQTDPQGRVPPELRGIVMQALEKDPDQRIATAHDFISMLQPIRESQAPIDLDKFETTLRLPSLEHAETAKMPSAHHTSSKTEVDARISNVRLLVGHSRFREARGELQQILDLDPGHSEASRTLEMVEEILKQQAFAELQGLITKTAEKIERCLERGDIDSAQDELDQAVSEFGESELFRRLRLRLEHANRQRLEERQSEQASSWCAQAEQYLSDGNLTGAQRLWQQVNQLSVANPEIERRQRELRIAIDHEITLQKRHEEERRRLADQRLKFEACLEKAHRFESQKSYEKALQEISNALEISPDDRQAQLFHAGIKASLEKQQAEEVRQERIQEEAAKVRHFVAVGDLDRADEVLTNALGSLGGASAWHDLLQELEEARCRKREEDLEELLRRAKLHLAEGDLEDAKETAKRALNLEPVHLGVRSLIAKIDAALRRRIEEKARLEARDRLTARIEEALDVGDLDLAERLLDEARLEFKANDEPWPELAVRLAEGRQAELQAYLEGCLRSARALRDQGDLEAALEAVQQALEVEPDFTEGEEFKRQLGAELEEQAREHQRQIALASAVSRIESHLVGHRLVDARQALEAARKDFEETEELIRLMHQLVVLERQERQDQVRAHLSAAQRGLEQQDFTASRQAARLALGIDIDDQPVFDFLQRVDDAEKRFEETRAQREAHQRVLLQIRTYLEEEQLEAAATAITEARASFGEDPELSRLQEALESLERTRRAEAWQNRARELLASGQLAQAEELLRQALELDPDSVASRQLLAEVMDARREQNLARQVGEIQALLDGGDLEATADKLLTAAQEFGQDPSIDELAGRLQAAQQAKLQDEVGGLVQEARGHFDRDEPETALPLLVRANELMPSHDGALRLLAEVRDEVEMREKERRRLAALAQIEASLEGNRLDQARQLLNEAEQEHGVESFVALRARFREREQAAAALEIELFLDRGQLRKAERALNAARQLDSDADVFQALQERYDQAQQEATARRAARLQKFRTQGIFGLAAVVLILIVFSGFRWLGAHFGKSDTETTEPPTNEQIVEQPGPSERPPETIREQDLMPPATSLPEDPPPELQPREVASTETLPPQSTPPSVVSPEPRVVPTTLTVLPARIDGGRVTLNGRPVDFGREIELTPGAHELLFSAPGHEDRQVSLRLSQSEARIFPFPDLRKVQEPLVPVEVPLVRAETTLKVMPGEIDGGRVTLDGRPIPMRARIELPPGLHRLVFSAEGYEDQEVSLELYPNEDRMFPFPELRKKPEPIEIAPPMEVTDTEPVGSPTTSPPAPPKEPAFQRGDLIEPGPGVVEPVKRTTPTPAYPRTRRRLTRTIQVVVAVFVDENGEVRQTLIRKRAPEGFEAFTDAAVEAAKEATFTPPTKDGIAGRMWTELAYDFNPQR